MSKKELTSLKGYFGVVKAIVIDTEDPDGLGRVKIQIPSYHGNTEDLDRLPWAQVCVTRVPTNGLNGLSNYLENTDGIVDAITNIDNYDQLSADISVGPMKGDVVWVIFEGGDINYPLVIGVLYSTIGSNTNSDIISGIGEGSPGALLFQIGIKYETGGDYGSFVSPAQDAYNGGSASAITIGVYQWMGVNAKALMTLLRSLNQTEFDKMASPSGLLSDVTGTNNWSRYNVSKSSAKGQAIISILKSSWGIKGQQMKGAQDAQDNIQYCSSTFNIKDVAAAMYCADMCHQYGRGGAGKYYKGRTIPNLETAFQLAPKTYMSRRQGVFNDIKQLRDSGKLNKNSSNSSDSSSSKSKSSSLMKMSSKLLSNESNYKEIDITTYREKFPFPLLKIRNITKYFEKEINPVTGRIKFHDGIDIYDKNIIGQPVIAVFDGKVSYRTDMNPNNGCGYEITITKTDDNNIQAIYRHLNKRVAKEGELVKQGDIIGIVGNTGSADFPLLHFSIKINGGYQNPLLYLTNQYV